MEGDAREIAVYDCLYVFLSAKLWILSMLLVVSSIYQGILLLIRMMLGTRRVCLLQGTSPCLLSRSLITRLPIHVGFPMPRCRPSK